MSCFIRVPLRVPVRVPHSRVPLRGTVGVSGSRFRVCSMGEGFEFRIWGWGVRVLCLH